ncbi:D123-domain-containing protein [Pilobolus umbonatus]|nr:D123-domain-containing protein [Pilobolus umbonatus]
MPSNDITNGDIAYAHTTVNDVLACSFDSWYPRFRSVTFKSKIIRLPTEFIEYLNADGIFLPEDGQPRAARIEEVDSDEEETDYPEEETNNKIPNFPEIEKQIRDAIYEYEGAVFPKLNWSSPRDAAWIATTQNLSCSSPFDVFLLLKSSDFINHDINHAFENCVDIGENRKTIDYSLILRKWYDLQPSMEFRCFVKHHEIIGITQRDLNYYHFLPEMKEELETLIHEFYDRYIADNFDIPNFVFDVYIHKERRKAYLVDLNPFNPTTDPILYDWHELITYNLGDHPSEFRVIQSQVESNAIACNAPKFATNMVPKDVIDMSNGLSIAEFAQEFERAMVNGAYSDNDSDSE